MQHFYTKINYSSSVIIKYISVFSLSPLWVALEGPLQSCHTVPESSRVAQFHPPLSVLFLHEWNGMVGQCSLIWRNAQITLQTRWGSWSRLSAPGCCRLSSSCDRATALQYSWCLWKAKINDTVSSVPKIIWTLFRALSPLKIFWCS